MNACPHRARARWRSNVEVIAPTSCPRWHPLRISAQPLPRWRSERSLARWAEAATRRSRHSRNGKRARSGSAVCSRPGMAATSCAERPRPTSRTLKVRRTWDWNWPTISLRVARRGFWRPDAAKTFVSVHPLEKVPSPRGPLAGVGVIVTRPARQAAGLARQLAALGAAPIVFSAIVILPPTNRATLDRAHASLRQYDIAIFVSANAAEYGVPAPDTWPAELLTLAPGP